MPPSRALATAALAGALLAGASALHAADPPNPIADLTRATGTVEVRDEDAWRAAEVGTPLIPDDVVRTGRDSLARIVMRDDREETSPTRVDLIPETQLALRDLVVTDDAPPKRTGFLAVLKGAIRTFTKGWSSGSVFSVKSGNTISGIRGSEVFQDGKTLVMLGGDVFKLHWKDEAGAREALARLAAREDLPRSLDGVEIRPLEPGYVGLFEEGPGGRVIARETVLAADALRELKEAFARWGGALDAGGVVPDVAALLAPLRERLAAAVAEARRSPPQLVATGGTTSRLEELLEELRERREARDVAPPVDRLERLRERTDSLEETLDALEDAVDKQPVLEELEAMLEELEALEAELEGR